MNVGLIEDAARFQISAEERTMLREEMIKIVGERFRRIKKHEWITFPLIEEGSPEISEVTWGDVAVGAFIAFMVGKYIA